MPHMSNLMMNLIFYSLVFNLLLLNISFFWISENKFNINSNFFFEKKSWNWSIMN